MSDKNSPATAVGTAGRSADLIRALYATAALLRQSSHTEEDIFKTFKEQIAKLGLRGSLALFVGSEKTELCFRAVSIGDSRLAQLEERFGLTAEGFQFKVAAVDAYQQIITTKQPLYLANVSDTIRQLLPRSIQPFVMSILNVLGTPPTIFVPLILEGEVIGTMNVSGVGLGEQDVLAMEIFANHITVALKNTQLALTVREAETLYSRLFDAANDGFVIAADNGRILTANNKMQELAGYTNAAMKQMTILDLHPPATAVAAQKAFNTVQQKGEHIFEIPLLQASGNEIIVQISATTFTLEDKTLVLGVVRDIHTQKEAEEALQSTNKALADSRDLLHRLIQQTPVGIQMFNSDGLCTDINETQLQIFGVPSRDSIVNKYNIFTDPFAKAVGTSAAARRALAGETVLLGDITFDFTQANPRFAMTSGTRTINVTIFPVLDENKQVISFVGLNVDVTARKEAEMLQAALYRIAALTTSDASLQNLYAIIHQIVGDLMIANNFFIAIYHQETNMLSMPYFVDELDEYPGPYPFGRGLTEYVIRIGRPLLLKEQEHRRMIEDGVVDLVGPFAPIWLGVPLEAKGRTFGAIVVQHYRDERVYTDYHKQILQFVSRQIASAIERKRSDEQLRQLATELEQQKNMLDVMLSTTPNYYFIYDRDGCCIYASPLVLQSTQRPLSNFIGKTLDELGFLMPDGFKDELMAVFTTGQSTIHEFSTTAGNTLRYFEYNLNPVYDKNDDIIYVVSTSRDVTEQKKAQEALWHTQKIESLGILAGGVAHDFNNLLVAMLGQASLAMAKLPPDSPVSHHIEKVTKAAKRAADLTQQLLAYSGRGQFAMLSIHLNELIQENLHLFELAIPKQAQLFLKLADNLPAIQADPGQIQQIVMNLILNAAEAIEVRDGQITIATRLESITTQDNRFNQFSQQPLTMGEYVLLEVTDNGVGMDSDTLANIFDPFFTTKFTGRGLGLAAVLGIVRGHRGGLSVVSQLGQGTTFELVFPMPEKQARVVAEKAPAYPSQTAPTMSPTTALTGHILVIDDEEPVLEAIMDILELENIKVITAVNGETGIDIYREHAAAIDMILLDLSMPGLSGRETFTALRQINPAVKILISSGYSEHEVAKQFLNEEVNGFIQKPYDLDTFVTKIRQCVLG